MRGNGGLLTRGTRGDVCSDDQNFCLTRINLIDAVSADVDVLSFGKMASHAPVSLPNSLVKIRL